MHRQRGFTIVELLIVIVIIGILAAITIVAFNGVLGRAKLASVQSDLEASYKLLANDNTVNSAYPASLALANGGQGLKSSNGTTYTYKATASSYCLLATNGSISSYITSAINVPVQGSDCPGIVTTFVGGTYGTSDGTGQLASFSTPLGLSYDQSSNILYITDWGAFRVRKVTPGGVVTTIGYDSYPGSTGIVARSGTVYLSNQYGIRKMDPTTGTITAFAGTNGTTGYAEGTGSAAKFSTPHGMAIDSSGNLFVADTNNSCIRKITPGGLTSTFVGTCTISGSDDGTGTAAKLQGPSALAIDSSNTLYFPDSYNGIRKVTSAGVVTTLIKSTTSGGKAGNYDGTFTTGSSYTADAIAINNAGDTLYITSEDLDNSNAPIIRKISLTQKTITTIAGGTIGNVDGIGSSAQFQQLGGISIDSSGLIYVSDALSYNIRTLK